MNIYLKKDIGEGVQFLLPEFLKDQEKKHLYAKIKKTNGLMDDLE